MPSIQCHAGWRADSGSGSGLGPQCVVDAIPESLAINTSLGHRLGYFVAPTLPYLHSEDQHMAYQRRAWILSFP